MNVARQLIENRRAYIPFKHYHMVEKVIEGFLAFTKEPNTYTQPWMFDVIGLGDHDDGWIWKREDGKPHDRKKFFHYRPRLLTLLKARGIDWHRHSEWLEACERFHQILRSLGHQIALGFDKALPGFDFGRRYTESTEHVLRFLLYDPAFEQGEVLGKEHTDRNFCTFPVAESRPGLRAGDEMVNMGNEDRLLVFTSQRAEDVTGGRIRAYPHQAVETAVSSADRGTPRWALIFFNHIDGTEYLQEHLLAEIRRKREAS